MKPQRNTRTVRRSVALPEELDLTPDSTSFSSSTVHKICFLESALPKYRTGKCPLGSRFLGGARWQPWALS